MLLTSSLRFLLPVKQREELTQILSGEIYGGPEGSPGAHLTNLTFVAPHCDGGNPPQNRRRITVPEDGVFEKNIIVRPKAWLKDT